MEKKNIIILSIIALLVILILVITSGKKYDFRSNQVEDFKKFYLPKKTKECLGKHGYLLENPSAKEKKECEDYVRQIWEEQRVLNNIE